MTQAQRKIIEDKAWEFCKKVDDKNYFIAGASAMDEILQKEIAELKEIIKDNEKTIIRLTNI